MSELHKHYLAGQLYCLPHILPMYAPTINSYKRLVEGAWAPTTITWAVENRTTAFRVINSITGLYPAGNPHTRLPIPILTSLWLRHWHRACMVLKINYR